MEIKLADVKEFFEKNQGNDEVKEFISTIPGVKNIGLPEMNDDKQISEFVASNKNIDSWFQKQKDAHFSKSLETWQKNQLPGITQKIENEMREKYMPNETPEQKRLREIEAKLNESENQAKRQKLENFAMRHASQLGISDKLGGSVDNIPLHDEESIKKSLNWFKEALDNSFEAGKSHYLKGRSGDLPAGGDPEPLPYKTIQAYNQAIKDGLTKYDFETYKKIAANQR